MLIGAGLAGCLDQTTDTETATDTPTEDEPSTAPQNLAFDGCREQLGAWEGLAYETVDPYLPQGFRPSSLLSEDTSGRNATLYVIGFICTEPRDAAVIFPWIPVTPPDALANPDAFYHAVSLPCIADPSTTEILRLWGVPCTAGDLGIDVDAQTPAGAAWTFTAENPRTTIRLQGGGPATDLPAGPELIPLFHAIDGQLCAVTDATIGVHQHWQEGPFTLEVEGEASFPIPEGPGSGLLAPYDLTLDLTHVYTEANATPGTGPCPAVLSR